VDRPSHQEYQLLHATCVALEHQGVLLLGPSGVGKSDLALRMIERGAVLVTDDQVELTADPYGVWAEAPTRLRGLLEVRGIGILRLSYQRQIPVRLVVELLTRQQELERLPEPRYYEVLGKSIPLIALHAFESSAPTKILFALRAMAQGNCIEGALTPDAEHKRIQPELFETEK
jgi:HPr kinase/phosphorylase